MMDREASVRLGSVIVDNGGGKEERKTLAADRSKDVVQYWVHVLYTSRFDNLR